LDIHAFCQPIREALEKDQFVLHYQPQVDIQTSRIIGAEALLRWDHPVEGTVMPQRIIPVAEQLGMITSITNWVLVTALRQCKQWSHESISIPVSVNVSARSFVGVYSDSHSPSHNGHQKVATFGKCTLSHWFL